MRSCLNVLVALVLPLLAGAVIFAACCLVARAGGFNLLLSHDVYESHLFSGLFPFFGVIAFFFGFIPAAAYGLNLCSPAAVTVEQQQEEEATEAAAAPLLYVGQTFTSHGANCTLRIKSLKVRAILEHHNELLADYL